MPRRTIGVRRGPDHSSCSFICKPADQPHVESTLGHGELIRAFQVPAGPWTRRSAYVKVRDRESYEFAMASAAVALHLDGDVVSEARIALGGLRRCRGGRERRRPACRKIPRRGRGDGRS